MIFIKPVSILTFAIITAKAQQPKTLARDDYIGCPENNDFYYSGQINSPFYPKNYPPNDKCFYFVHAEPGKVLEFKFNHWDLESCCDYVTIYDGPTTSSPVLVQIGGPGANVTTPASVYHSSTRFAVITFISNPTIQKSGFSLQYSSVNTATPCNRDIFLLINSLANVGSEANFNKELRFFANSLTPTWNVAMDKVRVMMNLQTDIDYAIVWSADMVPTNAKVTSEILGMSKYVPNVNDDSHQDLECLMRYTYDGMGTFGEKELDERYGIEQVAIVFVAGDANNQQDYNEAFEFAHKTRTEMDTKIIIIGVGNVNQTALSKLAYAQGFAFFANDYNSLPSLVPQINKAICAGLNSQCGP
ncbi:unnamed protein product [Caenorhabditis bovis]|uniref:CUB domain-containing protein n=1 Tax=Caenorhabditis bovis TaxID=2654633 RepID=A0A8S1EZZ9_9PELO|nr:unnamed protein product [Caenorhabditis bovis]